MHFESMFNFDRFVHTFDLVGSIFSAFFIGINAYVILYLIRWTSQSR